MRDISWNLVFGFLASCECLFVEFSICQPLAFQKQLITIWRIPKIHKQDIQKSTSNCKITTRICEILEDLLFKKWDIHLKNLSYILSKTKQGYLKSPLEQLSAYVRNAKHEEILLDILLNKCTKRQNVKFAQIWKARS